MTIPFERTRAVNYTRDFLLELTDPQKTPKVSKSIRQRALALLRHYPSEYDMDIVSRYEGGEPYVLRTQVFGKSIL